MTTAADFAALAASKNYAVLSLDQQLLLLPQRDIALLELGADLEPEVLPAQSSVAWLNFHDARWPTYCLGNDLELQLTVPDSRYICAVLSHDKGYFGLLCDAVDNIAAAELQLRPVPACMCCPDRLAAALAVRDDTVLMVTTSVYLRQFINRQQAVRQQAVPATEVAHG